MLFLVMMSTLVMIRITGKELRAEEVGLEHKDAEVKVFLILPWDQYFSCDLSGPETGFSFAQLLPTL